MNIWGICGAAIICIIFIVCFGKTSAKTGFTVTAGICIMLFISSIENIIPILDYVKELTKDRETSFAYVSVLIKCAGIGLVCSFTSELCRNSGEDAIASGIELFGKTEIIILCLPVIKSLLEIATAN